MKTANVQALIMLCLWVTRGGGELDRAAGRSIQHRVRNEDVRAYSSSAMSYYVSCSIFETRI